MISELDSHGRSEDERAEMARDERDERLEARAQEQNRIGMDTAQCSCRLCRYKARIHALEPGMSNSVRLLVKDLYSDLLSGELFFKGEHEP